MNVRNIFTSNAKCDIKIMYSNIYHSFIWYAGDLDEIYLHALNHACLLFPLVFLWLGWWWATLKILVPLTNTDFIIPSRSCMGMQVCIGFMCLIVYMMLGNQTWKFFGYPFLHMRLLCWILILLGFTIERNPFTFVSFASFSQWERH